MIADQSLRMITMTLWNADAEAFSVPVDSIVAIKSAKVSDFGGTRGGMQSGATASPGSSRLTREQRSVLRVRCAAGRSLSLFSSNSMQVDPDIPEARMLRTWYDQGGRNSNFTNASGGRGNMQRGPDVFRTLLSVKEDNLGTSDQVRAPRAPGLGPSAGRERQR